MLNKHGVPLHIVCPDPDCNRTFPSPALVAQHVRCEHQGVRGSSTGHGVPEEGSSRAITSPTLNASHAQCKDDGPLGSSVSADKLRLAESHPCSENGCNEEFPNRRKLESHVQISHRGIRPFPCTFNGCKVSFARNSDCLRHVRNVHKIATHIQCDIPGCGIMVARGRGYEKHKQKVHGGK